MTSMHPRKLARSMAKSQLNKEGATGYNKTGIIKGNRSPSFFSQNWKDYTKKAAKGGSRQ